jgi:hypothetical protein
VKKNIGHEFTGPSDRCWGHEKAELGINTSKRSRCGQFEFDIVGWQSR